MGKSSVIYVMGLSFIVGYALVNINSAGTDAISNYTNYYNRTVSRNIASSGANLGVSDVLFDETYKKPYEDVKFQGGTLNIWFEEDGFRKYVYASATLRTHTGNIRDTVVAELQKFNLARYGWFTDNEKNRGGQVTTWATGDTAFGPAHTNDRFNIFGKPVFMKKATAASSAVPRVNQAEWRGGFQWGVSVPYPTNLNQFVGAATTGGRVVNSDTRLDFKSDGTVRMRIPALAVDTTFASASQLAPNGAFLVLGANLRVEGTVSGDLAIGASPLVPGGVGGNVFITGDIVLKDDPRINPLSTDKLGIYAINDITVTYDNSNPTAYFNRKVEASIFSVNGEFNVQDVRTPGYPTRGVLRTYGAMMQKYRGEIGWWNMGGGLIGGYNKGFTYDDRLMKDPPKYYPFSGRYTLYSWREN